MIFIMELRITAVGSNQLIAEEIQDAVRLILGDEISVQAKVVDAAMEEQDADLFVCAKTQLQPLMKIVPVEKIVVLNLTPTSQFFVQVARIPQGETVYIFNNKLKYTQTLAEYCQGLGIQDVDFIPIAYEEMPETEAQKKLQQAKYIIGVDKLVGEEVLLSQRYAPFLRPDVQIFGAKRVASVPSACALIQWVAVYFHNAISSRVAAITANLQGTIAAAGVSAYEQEFAAVGKEVGKLVDESARSAEAIRKAVLRSVMQQISPDVAVSEGPMQDGACEQAGVSNPLCAPILKTLREISALSDKLLAISQLEKN